MGKKVDLTGQMFGKLVVLGDSGERGSGGSVMWDCICDCGERSKVRGDGLKSGRSTSCGCKKNIDLTSRRFGNLTVICKTNMRKGKFNVWRCLCVCGNYTEVTTGNLTNGHIKGCGCRRGQPLDLTGKRFGKLTAIAATEKRVKRLAVWECLCECGTRIQVTSNALMTGNTKSCGCFKLERLASMIGKNSPSYNPNLTDEERLKNRYRMSDGDFRSWANLIKERDNYTCQICNKHGGNLNAHHLNGWNAFPEQRFDPDNGVTLCTDCHKEFHSQYGYGDNTREQFDEYVESKTLVLN